ncbi:MAG: gmhA [Frankiales bacterium]|nr:gmhA [Frankiales bacterium]
MPSAGSIATEYLAALSGCLASLDHAALDRVVALLRSVRDSSGTVFVAGNGGSAATASHFVNDLGKATKASGQSHVRIMGLSDNISWLTALANDEGYERVFSGQLENFAGPGDLLVVISASGNSPNLLRAVEMAAERGTATVGLLGFDGGALAGMVDECLLIRTEMGAYGLAESAHSVVLDILTTCLVRDLIESPAAV